MGRRASSGLAESFAGVYTLLVVYASLYPFSGWRDNGAPLGAFLGGGWPRYWTVFDLLVNVLGYVPLGFLWAALLRVPLGGAAATLLAFAGGAALSLAMETLQNFLPTRVASNVDLGSNALGMLAGALAALRWGGAILAGGVVARLRDRLVLAGGGGDAGLLLLALWFLAQLNPEILLFGTGDLRRLLGLPAPLPFSAEGFSRLEAMIAGSATIAVGLLGAVLLEGARLAALVGLLAATLAVRMLAQAALVAPDQWSHWLTPGNGAGVAFGCLVVAVAAFLPRTVQRVLAALALLAATAFVNLAPDNPYLANLIQGLPQGQFLNFNGLTRLASSLWPFLALPWLMLAGASRRGNGASAPGLERR